MAAEFFNTSQQGNDECQRPTPMSLGESVASLRAKRNVLVEKSHNLHEQSRELDEEIEKLRATLDEERALKQSAIRRLAEKLCDPECAKIGPLTAKGSVVYERRLRQLKQQLDDNDLELLKRRQMAIDMYSERIAELDGTLARQDDEIRRMRVKLTTKERELHDLRVGLEPKSDQNSGTGAST